MEKSSNVVRVSHVPTFHWPSGVQGTYLHWREPWKRMHLPPGIGPGAGLLTPRDRPYQSEQHRIFREDIAAVDGNQISESFSPSKDVYTTHQLRFFLLSEQDVSSTT